LKDYFSYENRIKRLEKDIHMQHLRKHLHKMQEENYNKRKEQTKKYVDERFGLK